MSEPRLLSAAFECSQQHAGQQEGLTEDDLDDHGFTLIECHKQPCMDVLDFVEGTLFDAALSVLHSDGNIGKSFFALDLAWHIALGEPWRDKFVESGPVLYWALEGGFEIHNRLHALRRRSGYPKSVPFTVCDTAIDLLDDNDVLRVITVLRSCSQRWGAPVRFMVIDAMIRAAILDEDSANDMARLFNALDRIRAATGTHIMMIHPSGEQLLAGARRHSSCTDITEIELQLGRKSGEIVAMVANQHQLERVGRFAFRLQQVVIGQNRRGKDVTTCVVQPIDMKGVIKKKPGVKRSPQAPGGVR